MRPSPSPGNSDDCVKDVAAYASVACALGTDLSMTASGKIRNASRDKDTCIIAGGGTSGERFPSACVTGSQHNGIAVDRAIELIVSHRGANADQIDGGLDGA